MDMSNWRCSRCSLANSINSQRCRACGSRRAVQREFGFGLKGFIEYFGLNGFFGRAFAILGACTGAVAGAYAVSRVGKGQRIRGASLGAVAGAVLSLEALHLSTRLLHRTHRRHRQLRRRRPAPDDSVQELYPIEQNRVAREVHEQEIQRLLEMQSAATQVSRDRQQRLALINLLLQAHRQAQAQTQAPGGEYSDDVSLPLLLAQQQMDAIIDEMSYEELYDYFGGPQPTEGTSEVDLQQLPWTTAALTDNTTVEGLRTLKVCSICLEDFTHGSKIRCLPVCGHTFHLACVDKWLRQKGDCPLCRARVTDAKASAASSSS